MPKRGKLVTETRQVPLPSAEAQKIVERGEAEHEYPYPQIDARYGTEHILGAREEARAGIQDESRDDGNCQGPTKAHYRLRPLHRRAGVTPRIFHVGFREARDHTDPLSQVQRTQHHHTFRRYRCSCKVDLESRGFPWLRSFFFSGSCSVHRRSPMKPVPMATCSPASFPADPAGILHAERLTDGVAAIEGDDWQVDLVSYRSIRRYA